MPSITVKLFKELRNKADRLVRLTGNPTQSEDKVKYPNITVKLVGTDGNAFSILGKVKNALNKGGVSSEEISIFMREATSGNYDNLLQTCCKWVNVK